MKSEKIKQLIDYGLRIKELIVSVASVLLIIISAWFAWRIAPYAEAIKNNTGDIKAMQKELGDHERIQREDMLDVKQEIKDTRADIKDVKGVVDEINRYLRK